MDFSDRMEILFLKLGQLRSVQSHDDFLRGLGDLLELMIDRINALDPDRKPPTSGVSRP